MKIRLIGPNKLEEVLIVNLLMGFRVRFWDLTHDPLLMIVGAITISVPASGYQSSNSDVVDRYQLLISIKVG